MRYTTPKISKTTHLWYVHFRYDGKQFRYRLNYNQIEDQRIKQIHFEELCKSCLKKLREGWNPNIREKQEDKSELTIIEAFDFALKIKEERLQNDSYINLRSKVNRFKKAIKDLSFDKVKVVDIKNRHYEMILNKTSELFNLSNNSFNAYKICLCGITNELSDSEIIRRNFKIKIKNKTVTKEVAHIPANENEITTIKNHLLKNNSTFFYFWATMFHSGIRPAELLRVRLFMVDISEKKINLPSTITKNKKPRVVPINQYLQIILESLNIENLPNDFFLFGSANVKFGRFQCKSKEFVPGAVQIPRKQATTLWKDEIKDKLNISMTLYAIKKHSANSLILAGVSINAIKDLFGHSSEVTTQIYITNLKEINRKEILEKGTDF